MTKNLTFNCAKIIAVTFDTGVISIFGHVTRLQISNERTIGRPRMILIERYLKILTFLPDFVGVIVFFEIN